MDAERGSRIGAVLIWGTFLIGTLSVFLISPENETVRRALDSLGPIAPVAYLAAEVVQVVLIPIPGQPFEVAGGWLLGLLGGSIIGSLGALAGSIIAFRIGRRLGRPWVERHIAGRVRERVEERLGRGERVEWIVFWLMMIPNFPRDPLCYLAGISGMSTRGFILIAALGRPVGLVPWVALGAEGPRAGAVWQVVMIAAACAVWLGSRLYRRIADASRPAPEPEPEGEG